MCTLLVPSSTSLDSSSKSTRSYVHTPQDQSTHLEYLLTPRHLYHPPPHANFRTRGSAHMVSSKKPNSDICLPGPTALSIPLSNHSVLSFRGFHLPLTQSILATYTFTAPLPSNSIHTRIGVTGKRIERQQASKIQRLCCIVQLNHRIFEKSNP
ncbi:hypothetical protein BDQ17DRAFT_1346213 [Cyathus striatus]|nr:hypothetical protein BDQ17DRAFT_1346213 [Cyathus striatus]